MTHASTPPPRPTAGRAVVAGKAVVFAYEHGIVVAGEPGGRAGD